MLNEVPVQAESKPAAHEVPHLVAAEELPVGGIASDADALRAVIAAQAQDLRRLRRALVAASATAGERLDILRSLSSALPLAESAPQSASQLPSQTSGPRPMQVRSAMLDAAPKAIAQEILRVQEQVAEIVERSRWRQLGQRVGAAKRLAWEQDDWRTHLVGRDGTPVLAPSGDRDRTGVEQLIAELARLRALRDEVLLSRWRKLGQQLGLAKRLAWEHETVATFALAEVAPTLSSAVPAVSERRIVASAPTYQEFIDYTRGRFVAECKSFGVDVIFDVGANAGQFGQGVRADGYSGHLVSFEPLSTAHAMLTVAAADDPLWDVVDRCAVGSSGGQAAINIAGNSYSSSLLPMLRLHREAAPESTYDGIEDCPIITLDSYIGRTFTDPTTTIGLKIDTQGYEAQVLAGLDHYRDRVKVIVCEMSLSPLYAGAPTIAELCGLLAALGFQCVALGPEFEDPRTGELLQVDGVFVARDVAGRH